MGATSLLGVLQRANSKDVELTSTDDVFRGKNVETSQLIRAINQKLIKDYKIEITDDRMYLFLSITFNDGSIKEIYRQKVKFKL